MKWQLLKCFLGLHNKTQHPGIPWVWHCPDCRKEGNWS